MHRRQFLLDMTGGLIAVPALPDAGRLGTSDVQRIRATDRRLHHLDDQHGGARLADVAARYVAHVEEAMRRCSYGGKVRTALHQTLGELSASTGWFAFDAGKHAMARHCWDAGLRYALLAGDPQLQARVWSYMSRQACDLGHGNEAVDLARAALDTTRHRRDPRLGALLHSRVALGYSIQGEKARCAQSLNRAEQQLDRASNEDAPPWLAFCGPGEIAGQKALCAYNLGNYRQAAQADRECLALLPPGVFRRNEFVWSVALAQSSLAAGDADEALAAGHAALDLLPEVHSPRWAVRLTQFHTDVQDRDPAGAADFVDRYERATA